MDCLLKVDGGTKRSAGSGDPRTTGIVSWKNEYEYGRWPKLVETESAT